MPSTLASGFNNFHPFAITETPKNDLLFFNGLDPVQRWNGTTEALQNAGIPRPAYAPSMEAGGSGNLTGTYVCYVQFMDDEGVGGNLSFSTSITVTEKKLTWGGLPLSTDSRVTKRRLFRTTAGQVQVAYLVDTIEDNTTEAYFDDNTADASLDDNEYIVLANPDGSIPAEALSRTVPPNYLSAIVQHRNRMYAAVPVPYDEGHVEVEADLEVVTGVGTHWTDAMEGRRFIIPGHNSSYPYTIYAVTSPTSLTLNRTFEGTDDNFARYTIIPDAPELLNVYYSYNGISVEPESWPATFAFQPPAGSGAVRALVPFNSYLYICTLNKVFKHSVQSDPAIDGATFPAVEGRGCVNQRCWVEANGIVYLLDREGVWGFNGGPQPMKVDGPISNLFGEGTINWPVSKWFHAVFDRERDVVMFFVALGASYLPRHALCYSVVGRGWWIEEWPLALGASTEVQVASRRRTLLGCEHGRIMLSNEGHLDGIAPSTGGTLRGTVESASLMSLTDSNAIWPSSLADIPIAIVDGTGRGQLRRIATASNGVVTITQPWTILPDATSIYQIGGFEWRWLGTIFKDITRLSDTTFAYHLLYEPTEHDAHLFLKEFPNHSQIPNKFGQKSGAGVVYKNNGVRYSANEPDVYFDLKRTQSTAGEDEGYKVVDTSGNRYVSGKSDRWTSPMLHGHATVDGIAIYGLMIDGVRV